MAFKTVFYALQDVFPQVDLRILKAVASKYSSDINSAVEFVLSDVLPAVSESKPTEKYYPLPPKFDDMDQTHPHFEIEGKGSSLGNQMGFLPYPTIENYNPFLEDVPSSSYIAQSSSLSSSASSSSSTSSSMKQSMQKSKFVESSNSQYGSNLYPNEDSFKANANSDNYDATKDLIQLEDYSELPYEPLNNYAALNSESMANSTAEIDPNLMDYTMSESGYKNSSTFENESKSTKEDQAILKVSEEKVPLLPKETLEESTISEVPIISDEDTHSGAEAKECKRNSEFEAIDEMINHVTKSKDILSSAMKATISKIKEVELQEENAKRSREEAAKTDEKLAEMVEGLDNLIKTAKETNNEHASQVKKEKSLLVREAKELHSRVLNLSSEKDDYESIINEINSTLDARLVIAREENAGAQKELAEKEDRYLKIHAEKESTLEEINKESLILENEAEENSMLRELLLECGRKVDVLQGEISSINQEVMLLKEQVNKYRELNTAVHYTSVPNNSAYDIPVPLAPPCSLASSTFMEEGESRIFDGAASIMRNDYLTTKEHENEKELPQNQVLDSNDENKKALSDDEEWEIY
ncbi:ELKS/Rab6-interacting/CAST family protein [Rhynchospora pubera]|uniref:ELKS/Rab6-interacting/CAST family protein n=1 Tax=Rhynchospora pubera TaxID=906938 RepID=A0AAV8DJT0_9POAL|nr:ELKS/Rab6-interacting/CAST family protein [Rhynchospora pubera]